jgi:hypothetical protein
VEATRCFVTEKEIGMRLSVTDQTSPQNRKSKANFFPVQRRGDRSTFAESKNDATYTNELQDSGRVSFSRGRRKSEEWYCHVESNSSNDGRRILQLRHSQTGQYLYSDDEGNVGCCSYPSPSTFWYMEPAQTPSKVAFSPPPVSRNRSIDSVDSLLSMSTSSGSSIRNPDPPNFFVILTSKEHPTRRLSYVRAKCQHESSLSSFNTKGCPPGNLRLVTKSFSLCGEDSTAPGELAVWELQFTSGELCFMSNPVIHCQIRCNIMGQLSLSSKFDGWQVFRFIEVGNGDVAISSWTHYSKFLSSDADGQVFTVEGNKQGLAERWRLEPSARRNGVFIKSVAYERFLTIGRTENEVLWTTTQPNDYAVWHLDAAHSHVYYLTSLGSSESKDSISSTSVVNQGEEIVVNAANVNNVGPFPSFSWMYSMNDRPDMHISSSKRGPFLTANKRKWEEWKVEMENGVLTFFSLAHEKFLGCNSSGQVHTTTSKGSWCRWEMEESPLGGHLLRSLEHNRYLAVNSHDGSLCTTPESHAPSLYNLWRLDPRLPHTINARKVAGKCYCSMKRSDF